MKKNFLSINIAKLPVCTTEQGVEIIKSSMGKLSDWNNLLNLIPSNFKKLSFKNYEEQKPHEEVSIDEDMIFFNSSISRTM